jgi:type II secretory pathway component PulF
MPIFSYQAKNGSGKALDGVIEADTQFMAVDDLSQRGLYPTNIKELFDSKANRVGSSGKVGTKAISLFTRQLSDLLEAGVPLLRGLEVTENQAENTVLANIIGGVRTEVAAGKSLSESLANYPNAFPPVYVSLIRPGRWGRRLGPFWHDYPK